MSHFSTTSNKNTNTGLASAFAQMALASAQSNLADGVTWNGDVNFALMGSDFKAKFLELDQKMVTPQDSLKKAELDAATVALLDSYVNQFVVSTKTMNDIDRSKTWGLMFRYLFYVRSVRAAGKKSRLLFYYLFSRLYSQFPRTCCAMLSLVPEFGYFGDLDVIISDMGHNPDVKDAALEVYKNHLDADCKLLWGKSLVELRDPEMAKKVAETNTQLKTLSVDEVRAFVGARRFSLAAKWFPREGKSGSDFRKDFLIKVFYPFGGIKELERISPDEAKTRLGYLQMLLRRVLSTLNQCLLVGENMMCETNEDSRTWGDIPVAVAPAKFVTKYRKALANEKLKESVPEYMVETGNRFPHNDDRVVARQNLLKALIDGKLKGAAQDIDRLSKIVFSHLTNGSYGHGNRKTISSKLSATERQVIATQWSDLVTKVKKEIIEAIEAFKEEAEESGSPFLDPRNVIPVVDTSGSMESARVQDSAVGLGILATSLSSMPGCLISFSEKPEVFHLDMSGKSDVFDHFLAIMNGPTGLSTNVDATYRLLLQMMVNSGCKATDFALLFLSDGQFDAQCYCEPSASDTSSRYLYSRTSSAANFQKTFIARLEKAFADKGYNLPRTIFWNLNAHAPGFSATADMKGLQMVSGYSQTLMIQVFTGDYKYEVQADGSFKVSVDPWETFLKALLNPAYDQVVQVAAMVGEGCMVHIQKGDE